jgi:hypothetical protein
MEDNLARLCLMYMKIFPMALSALVHLSGSVSKSMPERVVWSSSFLGILCLQDMLLAASSFFFEFTYLKHMILDITKMMHRSSSAPKLSFSICPFYTCRTVSRLIIVLTARHDEPSGCFLYMRRTFLLFLFKEMKKL